jgi:PAS domain S-box-containing protein
MPLGGRGVSLTGTVDEAEGPAALLQKALTAENHDEIVKKLVAYLHRTTYSIVDLLSDAAQLKNKMATGSGPIEQLINDWTLLDQTIADCVAFTSFRHEKIIENTLHAFCELDRNGTVTSANSKMLELAPGCVGQNLPARFGKMGGEVQQALAITEPRRLYQIDLETGDNRYPVLAEFGKVEVNTRSSGYALLVDMSDLVEAERKALEAAPYAMLKLDSKQRVLYANKKALDLFELPLSELLGRDARRFVRDEQSLKEVIWQSVQRRKGRGSEYRILFNKPRSGTAVHLRVLSIPSFDTAGRFVGSLAELKPINQEIARDEIARLVATEANYEKLFDDVIKIVQRFVPFDWADLSMYSPQRDFSGSILRYPDPHASYHTRWFPIPETFRDWLEQPQTWIDDLKPYLARTPDGQAMMQTPDMQRVLAEGRRALIAVPVKQGGEIIGALSLQSKQPGQYDAKTMELLRRLAVDQALHAMFNAYRWAERDFVSDLLQKISMSTNHKELAQTVVSELARFYKYRNVSIFKINALRGYFRLLAQECGPQSDYRMPEAYTQPLDRGLLGLVYQSGKPVLLQDANENSNEARAFVRVASETMSQLCVPILLRGRLLWILSLEDPQANAFTSAQVEPIRRIIDQIEQVIDRMFQNLVIEQVLDVYPQAVVITGVSGNILGCNKNALVMFERESVSAEDNLDAFLPNPEGAEAARRQSTSPVLTEVVGQHGKQTPVLLSTFTLPEEYDHLVVLLEDVAKVRWQTDFERLKAALAEVSAQVRVPLSLVSSFVQQIGKKTRDGNVVDLAKKAVGQLGRIELTYDRVVASYDADKIPSLRPIPVDVKLVLDHIYRELPGLDRRSIKLSFGKGDAVVLVDTYRLVFALESMLTYLVRSRANADFISIKVQKLGAYVEINMIGPVQQIERKGQLADLVEVTRTQIALGTDALGKIALDCGGTFKREVLPKEHEKLTMRIPAVNSGNGSLMNRE